MSVAYPGLVHLNGNLMAAVDLETTGRRPGYHEVIQVAVVPLDNHFKPLADVQPFYTNMKPLHPERAEKNAGHVHGLSIDELVKTSPHPDLVADLLHEWVDRLRLPPKKSLVPLAHNWAFESAFLTDWLGVEAKDALFHAHARDSMLLALGINDRCVMGGEYEPFRRVNLAAMCKILKVTNHNPHDALSDSLAEAQVYKRLLQWKL